MNSALYLSLFVLVEAVLVWSVLPVASVRNAVDGGHREVIFGKDRELLHASVDLRWLFKTLTDKETWMGAFGSIACRLKRLNSDFDAHYTYREVATDLLCEIRQFNAQSPLRVLQCSLGEAHQLSLDKGRLMVFYIEKETWEASRRTVKARTALSSTQLGDLLNEQFLFMTSVDTHPYSIRILRDVAEHRAQRELLGQLAQLESKRPLIQNEGAARTLLNSELERVNPQFPMLVVLSPISPPPPLWNLPVPSFMRPRVEFEVVGVLHMHAVDASVDGVRGFLQRVVFAPLRRPNHHFSSTL